MIRFASLPFARPACLLATMFLLGCGEVSDGTLRNPSPADVLHLEINNSRGMEHVNGNLLVTVQTQGGTPDKIELTRNGRELATLLPPFQYIWDTTVVEEGLHRLQARAQWKGRTFTSDEHPVSVDRTGPLANGSTPNSDNTSVDEAATLRVSFSEPIRLRRPQGVEATVQVGDIDWTVRMTLSDDGLSLSAPLERRLGAPSEGRASMPLEDITDVAGNPAQFNPHMGARVVWHWTVPVFRSEPALFFELIPGQLEGVDVAGRPALVVEPGGATVTALADRSGMTGHDELRGARIVVARLEGSVWSVMGAPFVASDAAEGWTVSHPLLALGAERRPVVAFQQHASANAGSTLHVFQWMDSAWQPVGAHLRLPEGAVPHASAMVIDSEGRPVVAWGASDGIHVWRWSAGQWLALGSVQRAGAGPESTVSTDAPALSVDGAGGVFLAWAEAESSYVLEGLYVRYWNGSGWDAMGGRLVYERRFPSDYRAAQPALATLPNGSPVVVWSETSLYGHHGVMVARWSGSAWSMEVATTSEDWIPAEERRWPTVAVDGQGRVLMTFIAGQNRRGLHAVWYPHGGQIKERLREFGPSGPTALALDVTGQPVIAVSERSSLSIFRPNR
ncbi:hypothetical protein [Myxococcus sp. Y35]|uniref:hypothetical protein n=1 Tax=Pseudomyxococcus flavus TaxID=3115648 RepID=UPI003CEB154A